MDRPIWEGIYQDIHEINAIGDGFNSDTWVNQSKVKVQKYLSAINERNVIPPAPLRPTSLPLVAAMLKTNRKGSPKIVDYGGGLGFSYLSFMQSCVQANKYQYHIIESREIYKAGEEMFSDPNLFFHLDIRDLSGEKVSVVYMNSVLQYVADWKSLIANLVRLNPEIILMDDVPAGDIPTFATFQNYYESRIPCWFFDVNEIISLFETHGFCLEQKSKFFGEILGKITKLPMSNFPPENQLDHACTLLFLRNSQ